MNQKDDIPIGLKSYVSWAERYAAAVDSKPYNAHSERPAMLSLLPEVKGKQVLDAGCGPGWYSEHLVSSGAKVTAIDVTPKMVEITKERLGTSVEVYEADLSKPLDFLEDESFDCIVCSLTLHYIEDWANVFEEMYRILRKSGHLVFSTHHPFNPSVLEQSKYFETELVEEEWGSFGKPKVKVQFFNRPLSEMILPLHNMCFLVEQIIEPRLTEEGKEQYPEFYERLSQYPWLLCVRAKKKLKA